MTRERKFRVWDKQYKKYIKYPVLLDLEDQLYERTEDDFLPKLDMERLIVEQYTGLKDKNGKEVYEGDVLGNEWENGYISWCDKCKQFQYYIFGECMACSGDVQWYELVADDGKLEIISNVHESPELVGGEE